MTEPIDKKSSHQIHVQMFNIEEKSRSLLTGNSFRHEPFPSKTETIVIVSHIEPKNFPSSV